MFEVASSAGAGDKSAMARKLRLEYEGALYHVYSRGNYRTHIFREEGAKEAFMTCLEEACEKSGWVLHAYALMGNHYHFALETPRGNLVEGMRWFQSTFANRFNRFRSEQGHVFQGRYCAKLLENEAAVAAVAHYIHLNPVEAGLVTVEQLETYRFSSFAALFNPKNRPACLQVEAFLTQAGKLADTPAGRRSYRDYLAFVSADMTEQKRLQFDTACKGWAMGSEGWKRGLVEQYKEAVLARGYGETDVKEARELIWDQRVAEAMKALGVRAGEELRHSKSAPWKVAIAAQLKAQSHVKNGWLAQRLHMGAPEGVSRYVSELQAGQREEAKGMLDRIANIKV